MNVEKSNDNTLAIIIHDLWFQYTNAMAHCVHDDWDAERYKKESNKFYTQFCDSLRDRINFNNMTKEAMLALRFKEYHEYNDLMLIPLYLLSVLPKGITVIDIFGNPRVYDGANIDTDTRGGYLAVGLYPIDSPHNPYNQKTE